MNEIVAFLAARSRPGVSSQALYGGKFPALRPAQKHGRRAESRPSLAISVPGPRGARFNSSMLGSGDRLPEKQSPRLPARKRTPPPGAQFTIDGFFFEQAQFFALRRILVFTAPPQDNVPGSNVGGNRNGPASCPALT